MVLIWVEIPEKIELKAGVESLFKKWLMIGQTFKELKKDTSDMNF